MYIKIVKISKYVKLTIASDAVMRYNGSQRRDDPVAQW